MTNNNFKKKEGEIPHPLQLPSLPNTLLKQLRTGLYAYIGRMEARMFYKCINEIYVHQRYTG